MRTFALTLTIVCLLLLGAAHGEDPVKAVVITGDHPFTRDTFLGAFEGHEGIEYTHAPQQNHEEIFDNIRDWPYDVMVFYHFSMTIPEHRLRNLLALIEQGVGLIVMHHGGMTYWDVEELRDVYGIRWNPPDYAFHLDQEYTAHIADPDHPITRGLSDFPVHDETYTGFQIDDYPGNHTLITADHPKSDNVVAWVRHYGVARVAGFQLGHDSPVFTDPNFKTIMGRMTLWATGRLPDKTGGPVLEDTTIYREHKEAWFDQALLESDSGEGALARDIFHARVLAAHNSPATRQALANRFALLLERPGTVDAKRFLLRQLAYLRHPEAAGPVIRLLGDPGLGQMARHTLEGIPGEDVDNALRLALAEAEGTERIGLLNSVARRGGDNAVAVLVRELDHAEASVAQAAIDGLGRLATPEAIEALLTQLTKHGADDATARAILACAQRAWADGRPDARRNLLEALTADAIQGLPDSTRRAYYQLTLMSAGSRKPSLCRQFVNASDAEARHAAYEAMTGANWPGATDALTSRLPKSDPSEQVVILEALRHCGDTQAGDSVRALLTSESEDVRVAAIRALATTGSAEDVSTLMDLTLTGSEREAKSARAVLARMPGVAPALASAVSSGEARRACLALEVLADRYARDQIPVVLEAVTSDNPSVAVAAWACAGALADPGQLAALQARAKALPETAEAVSDALARIARKADSPDCMVDKLCDFTYEDDATRAAALTAVAKLGTNHALDRLTGALKDDAMPVQAAALRALATWDNPAPAPHLLNYARATENGALREQALMAYTNHVRKDGALSPTEMSQALSEVLALTAEQDTRAEVLQALGNCGDPGAFVILRDAMADPGLAKTAMRATLRLASALAADFPDESLGSLRHLAERTKDEGFRAEVESTLRNVEEYRGRLLAQWGFAEGTDGWNADNQCSIKAKDGILHIETKGGDPFLSVPVHTAAGAAEIVMRAQFDVEGAGQFFWYYEDEAGFSVESPFAVFDLKRHEDGWVDFRIPINLERPLGGLRIDPGMDKGHARIDYIRLERPAS